jgi:predicted RNase H-like HicB family nuclease
MALYSIRLNLELYEPGGVYTVTSPDVPGLVTEGSTPEEITRNVQEVLEVLMLGWKKHGLEIPLGQQRPESRHGKSHY